MDLGNAALVVIDMQNGFVNHHSRDAVPAVRDLVARWSAADRPVIFTRYFHYPDSPYERFFRWERLQQPPETDIVPDLAEAAVHAHAVIDKTGYTLFTPDAAALIRQGKLDRPGLLRNCHRKLRTEVRRRRLRARLRALDRHRCLRERRRPGRPRRRARRGPPPDRHGPTRHLQPRDGATRCVRTDHGAGIAPWPRHRPALVRRDSRHRPDGHRWWPGLLLCLPYGGRMSA